MAKPKGSAGNRRALCVSMSPALLQLTFAGNQRALAEMSHKFLRCFQDALNSEEDRGLADIVDRMALALLQQR